MANTVLMDHDLIQTLRELGQQLRIDAVRSSSAAGPGHPTSSLSAADLMAVLLSRYLRYNFADPRAAENDHLIFSKGHASPLLYAMFKAAGAISDAELLTYRSRGSRLEGRPTPRLPWVEFATGSLGQGLPIGVGLALTGRCLGRLPYRTWVLCGDSELAEGSVWEAFEHAGWAGLDNLTAIIDVNRLGPRGPTRHGWDTAAYARCIQAFDWHTIEIDGHDPAEIDRAFAEAVSTVGQPTAVLARTRKGRGCPRSRMPRVRTENLWQILTRRSASLAGRDLPAQPSSSRKLVSTPWQSPPPRRTSLRAYPAGLLSVLFHDPEDFFAHRTKKSSGS